VDGLILTLTEMSQEIESDLHVVTHVARHEWRSLQSTWSCDGHLRKEATRLTEAQLQAIVAKVRRFKDIVHGLASSDREAHGPVGATSTKAGAR
jgi:hypothetical protein